MTTDQMRCAIVEAYPGPRWKERVKGMSDERVIAMYKRMEREGRLYKHRNISEKTAR